MDDETRECMLLLAGAIEHVAAAIGSAGDKLPDLTEAGMAAQNVINRLGGASGGTNPAGSE
jgi:hypothetical protein